MKDIKIHLINEESKLNKLFNYLLKQKEVGLDIETDPNLDMFEDPIVCIQLGTKEHTFVFTNSIINSEIFISLFTKLLSDKTVIKVGHNLQFEQLHLYIKYNTIIENMYDTMIAEILLYLGYKLPNDLSNVAKRRLKKKYHIVDKFDLFNNKGTKIDKTYQMTFRKYVSLDNNQIYYAAVDAYIVLYIKEEQQASSYFPTKRFNLECSIIAPLALMTIKGFDIDKEAWIELSNINKERAKVVKEILLKYLRDKTHFVTFDLFNYPSYKLDIDSSKDCVEILKHLAVCPKAKSKTTKVISYTSESVHLKRVIPNEYKDKIDRFEYIPVIETPIDFITNLLIYRRLKQAYQTFGEEYINKYVNKHTDRVHTNFNQLVDSTRMSSRNPNLQQIPGNNEFRNCFYNRNGIVDIDYDSQELRIAACVVGSNSMKTFFNEGHPIFKDDYHSYKGTDIYRIYYNDPNFILDKNIHKKERQNAKSFNFGVFFGKTPYTFSMDLGVEIEVAEKLYNAYVDSVDNLREYMDKSYKNALINGYVHTDVWGTRRYFKEFKRLKKLLQTKEDNSELGSLTSKLKNMSLNSIIQGSAALMMKLAILLIHQRLPNSLINVIHDQALLEYNKEEDLKIIETCLEEAGNILFKDVKFSATAELLEKWKK